MKKNSKQRLFEVMWKIDPTFKPKLNEGDAFNDAGEPMMTHSQFRDYSEPSEPEYDDSYNSEFDDSYSLKKIVNELEKRFNTIIEYHNFGIGENSASFFTKGYPHISLNELEDELEIYAYYYENNKSRNEKLYSEDFNNVNIDDIIKIIEPYRNIIKTGVDAEKAMNFSQAQDAADRAYSSHERSMFSGQ